jgi:predicted O-methyltransferase YrrM
MNYIGDISKNDFLVLQEAAMKYENILEFGVGASTQVILNYTSGNFTSIDTSPEWIDLTRKNLEYLNINKPLDILLYEDFQPSTDDKYDFVFNDGVDHFRSVFGIFIFPYIKVGGVLAYHDTRRGGDMMNVIELVRKYYNEIDVIEMNKNNSNITLVRKKEHQPYEEWNIAEGKINLRKGGSVFKDTIPPPHMM